ncbi:MAG: glycosyltransferase family 39 protein [Acidobacteriota bacterium]
MESLPSGAGEVHVRFGSMPGRALQPPLVAAALLAGLLAFFALGRLGAGIGGMLQPNEATFGEAILYDHAARIVRGEPLYQPPDRLPYTVAAYTPLYYGVAAALQAVVGPTFLPGRLVSLAAGLAAAALVGRLAGRRARSRWAGLFAASLFLALGFPGRIPFFALYKEDMLGVALALGAVSTLAGGRSTRRLIVAGALAALAILTKQTLIAAALAGTAWLLQEDRKKAAVFAGVCLAIVLATCAAFEIGTGAFFANTFFANAVPFRKDALRENLDTLRQFQTVPLALAALCLLDRWRQDRKPQADLLLLYWAACLLAIPGFARPGSAHNYWIELAAATAVLATLAIWARLRRRDTYAERDLAVLLILLLAASVALRMRAFGPAAVPVRSLLKSLPKPQPEFGKLVERVRSERREVLADPPDVVVLAGRRNLLELYFSSIRHSEGRLNLDPLVRKICRGEVGLLVIRYRLDSDARGIYQGYPYWPPPILAALRETMTFQAEQAGRFVYAPLDSAARAVAAGPSGICRGAALSR